MDIETRTGGRLLADALGAHGIRHVFTLPGGHLDPLYDASIDTSLEMISTRHEQAAVHMAEGWAWATGDPGVAAVTAGPGVTNAVTGIVDAWSSCVPLLLIGGRVSIPEIDTRALQDVDQLPLIQAYTRLARTVLDGRRIGEYTSRALSAATAGRPGPAYLEVPADVLGARHPDVGPVRRRQPHRPAADPRLIDVAAEMIGRSERPVCVAGSGVHWSRAADALVAFAEAWGIPVLTHKGARGAMADDHELCVGSAFPLAPGALAACSSADLVLVAGARLDYTLGHGRAPFVSPDARVVQIDVDPEEPWRGRAADVALVGDAKAVLRQLTASATTGGSRFAAWAARVRGWRDEAQAAARSSTATTGEIHPLAVVHAASDAVGRDGTIVLDGGETLVWGHVGTAAYRPGRTLAVGPLGTLGVGLPFGIAAKIARPDEPCVVVCGDGAFGFNAMEVETAVRHDVAVVTVIVNDRSWGMCRHGQGLRQGYDRLVAVELGDARYDLLARAMGAEGWLVKDASELASALDGALSCGRPACIDVRVDRSAVSPFTRMLGSGR